MKVLNRRASHDYQLLEKFEAGIALSGPEVKSVREGKISLEGSFARIAGGEAWLFNCHIHPYRFADTRDLAPSRSRKFCFIRRKLSPWSQK